MACVLILCRKVNYYDNPRGKRTVIIRRKFGEQLCYNSQIFLVNYINSIGIKCIQIFLHDFGNYTNHHMINRK